MEESAIIQHGNFKMVGKPVGSVFLSNNRYVSPKGFYVDENKISKYFLNDTQRHAREFSEVGYLPGDDLRLAEDFEKGFDLNRKTDEMETAHLRKFSIIMELGITVRKKFRTVWQDNGPREACRMITAYLDRRVNNDD